MDQVLIELWASLLSSTRVPSRTLHFLIAHQRERRDAKSSSVGAVVQSRDRLHGTRVSLHRHLPTRSSRSGRPKRMRGPAAQAAVCCPCASAEQSGSFNYLETPKSKRRGNDRGLTPLLPKAHIAPTFRRKENTQEQNRFLRRDAFS